MTMRSQKALLSRGKKEFRSITLNDEVSYDLIERIIRDFNEGAGALREWYHNQVEVGQELGRHRRRRILPI